MPTCESFGPGLFPNTDDGQTTANTLTYQGSGGVNVGGSTPLNIANTGITAAAATALPIKSGTTAAVTLDSGTTGAVNVGTGANVKTVAIGSTVSGSKVNIAGEIDGVTAGAGFIGQAVQSIVLVGAAVGLTTATPANITSIALTAGDWDIQGQITFVATTATILAGATWEGGINSTSATLPVDGSEAFEPMPLAITTQSFNQTINISRKIVNSNAASTQYLVAEATFTAGTVAAYGNITARRMH